MVNFKKKRKRKDTARTTSALDQIGVSKDTRTEAEKDPDYDPELKDNSAAAAVEPEEEEDPTLLGSSDEEEMAELKQLRQKKKAKLANAFSSKEKLKQMVSSVTNSQKSDRSTARDTTQTDNITVEMNMNRKDALNKMLGPAKAPANVRIISRFDYQPDICKDWKDSGYCGYGDSCKFMHDRGDYKSGAQLEKEWEEEQELKRKAALGEAELGEEESYVIDEAEDDLPFACLICRGEFKKPVVTKCNHYFCEQCALKRYSKSSRCAACGAQTHGVFNTAHKIIKNLSKLSSKREQVNEAAEEALQSGQRIQDSQGFGNDADNWVIP